MSAKIISQAPNEVLKIINQRIGSKMLVKLTEKTAVNTTKAVPIVGSVVGSSFDYFETKQLAKIAYKEFIANKEENPEAPLFDDDDVYNPDYIGI